MGKVSSLTKHRTHSIAFSKGLTASSHASSSSSSSSQSPDVPSANRSDTGAKVPIEKPFRDALFLHAVDASVISRVPPFPGGRGSCAVRLKLPYSTNTLQCDRKHWRVCLSSCTECTCLQRSIGKQINLTGYFTIAWYFTVSADKLCILHITCKPTTCIGYKDYYQ